MAALGDFVQFGGFMNLKKIHTKTLLKWQKKARTCGGSYDPTGNHETAITIDDIKAELDTREHIPNKKEAKHIRQLSARQRRRLTKA